MPDGKVIVIADGVITEIREAEEQAEEKKTTEEGEELAKANARIAELKAELATAKAEAEGAKALAKTKEEMEILNAVKVAGGKAWLAKASSEYKPAKRDNGAKGAEKVSLVKERLAKYNK